MTDRQPQSSGPSQPQTSLPPSAMPQNTMPSNGVIPQAAAPQHAVNATLLAPPPQAPHHLMGMVSNPALAAAAAAGTPLFPPPGMLNGPGAFLALPEAFAGATVQHPPGAARPTAPAPGGVMVPRMAAVIGNQAVANGFNGATAPQSAAQDRTHPQAQQVAIPGTVVLQPSTHAQPNTAIRAVDPNLMVQTSPTTLGGVPIPALPPNSSTAMQVQVAAAAAAAAAAPLKSAKGKGAKKDDKAGRSRRSDLTPEERAKQNRDRNREHARSTRLRKKAYVQKLKELVEGLHAERTEEARKRRVAVQHLAEVQGVRRAVVRSFLKFHSSYESDPRKWMTILEDNFWFKQPVTPYRSFQRAEIEQECRISRGIEPMVADSASVSVMVEGIGSRSSRWMQIKRDEVLSRFAGPAHMPDSIVDRNGRIQNAISSLSSSSGSTNGGSGSEEDRRRSTSQHLQSHGKSSSGDKQQTEKLAPNDTKKVSSSSGSSSESRRKKQPQKQPQTNNDFHDYHAPALPDPMLGDSEGSSQVDSAMESNNSSNGAVGASKQVSTDSSSGEEDKLSEKATKQGPPKRRRVGDAQSSTTLTDPPGVPKTVATHSAGAAAMAARAAQRHSGLPNNIAKKGGISHNIRSVAQGGASVRNGNSRLSMAPAIQLPPFVGIGKRAALPPTATVVTAMTKKAAPSHVPSTTSNVVSKPLSSVVTGSSSSTNEAGSAGVSASGLAASSLGGPNVISPDADTSSSSSNNVPQIRAYYHVNEDDMLLTDDVLMCPFIFRSQDAVLCGALAECIMPGMLRANFSQRNKLLSLEMVYDAMGFMQQLERASGSEGTAQIVPGSLEMALSPNTNEARVITLAQPPFLIVSVNEAWTRMTKYTQMEVESKELSILNGSRTSMDNRVRPSKPAHKFDEVAKGRCACSAGVHYDKDGREFVDFVCSYPLTNANDDITHLLHVYKELPALSSPPHEFPESSSNGYESMQNS